MNVLQDEILTWSSSIEMFDRYAAYLLTENEQYTNEKICNCSSGTFGKFCEYKFLTKNSFEDTIDYQFNLKKKYRYGSQLWGNITCYITLINFYSGLRCLTWQNICDGKQQCIDGIDEDNCEELEFNECENNEYRCQDGSCIPEQYWLDGQYDCSDKSDEQKLNDYILNTNSCPLISSRFNCDETKGHSSQFACGDGQFVKDNMYEDVSCYNYRLDMFFCEFIWLNKKNSNMWTLENGHCVEYGWLEKHFLDMNKEEKCIFYLKCNLTNGKNIGCKEANINFRLLCENEFIFYPAESFHKPYIRTIYQLDRMSRTFKLNYVFFNGSVKCIGHQAHSRSDRELYKLYQHFQIYYPFDNLFCNDFERMNRLGPQFDKNCWNNTKQSFYCDQTDRCISKYRIRDDYYDCFKMEDEFSIKECQILKKYIQSPLLVLIKENSKSLLFRHYCDTIWQVSKGFDESFCNQWKCSIDEYQCLTGHCIPINYMMNRVYSDWNCPDASDKIGLFRISNLSDHNAKFLHYSWLEQIKK